MEKKSLKDLFLVSNAEQLVNYKEFVDRHR